MKETVVQIISVLFSDIRGFSKIEGDSHISVIKTEIDAFANGNLTRQNHFLFKTWGDGILVCCYNPHDLLEIALKLNSWFETKNWKRLGFPEMLQLRTGLHMEKANVEILDGKVVDVSGKTINTAARIEPIVDSGKIYCSEMFKSLASEESEGFVTFLDLGIRELAKGFGNIRLFEVVLPQRSLPISAKSPSTPDIAPLKIRKDFSQPDKDKYLDLCFGSARDYLKNAMEALVAQGDEIQAVFKDARNDKFTCEVYWRGSSKAKCQVWLGNSFGKAICYFEGINDSDNAMNESFSVQTDGFQLHLASMGFSSYSGTKEKVTEVNVGQVLWERFRKAIER